MPDKLNIVPPTAYQGGKQRIANQIVDVLLKDYSGQPIYDLCCGSGSISIELINRGIPPQSIIMVDQSPWGLFWKEIGEGKFNVGMMEWLCSEVPKDPSEIQSYIKLFSKQPSYIATSCIFLLLQAASFGSKAIWIKDDKWMNCSFRGYWLPTATSSRRSPVNPMMPMPPTLLERVSIIAEQMVGIKGYSCNVWDVPIIENAIVYIDPPYSKGTAYGHTLDVLEFIKQLNNTCFVSEDKPLSDKTFKISSSRKKGGISGERKTENEEWLSRFN